MGSWPIQTYVFHMSTTAQLCQKGINYSLAEHFLWADLYLNRKVNMTFIFLSGIELKQGVLVPLTNHTNSS